MDPGTAILAGAGITAGGNLLGSALSDSEGRDPTTSAAYWQNRADQREFAKHGIRWRVKDAKAAGLHPVFALGGSLPSYQPSTTFGGDDSPDYSLGRALADSGQAIGRAVATQETAQERAEGQARLAVLAAQVAKDEAMANYYNSEAARRSSAVQVGPPFPGAIGSGAQLNDIPVRSSYVESHPLTLDAVQPKAASLISSRSGDRSITAAPAAPALSEYQVAPNFRMLLPQSEEGVSEAMEVPWFVWPAIIGRNVQEYGMGWLHNAARMFFGGKTYPMPAPIRYTHRELGMEYRGRAPRAQGLK